MRHSLNEPHAYVDANLVGFLKVLEGCRHSQCRPLLYASSSSVYGANRHMPFRTSDNVDHLLNLYGARKKANELMAHAYAHLFCLTCYGAAIFHGLMDHGAVPTWRSGCSLMPSCMADQAVQQRPNGPGFHLYQRRRRGGCVAGRPAAGGESGVTAEAPDPATSQAPWRVYNIGNSKSVEVEQVVRLIEQIFGKSAIRELLPMQPGNVLETYADVSALCEAVGSPAQLARAAAGRRGASPAAIPAEWICTGDDISAGRTCDMVALRIVIGFGTR